MPRIVMREGETDFIGGMIFHRRVKKLMENAQPDEPVIIDLRNNYLDSSLIGTLLAIHTSCAKGNRRLELENVSAATRKVLKLTGLGGVLGLEGNHDEKTSGTADERE